MTKDEWKAEIDRLSTEKASLIKEDSALLQVDIDNLKAKNIQSYDDCMKGLYAIIGATQADVDNFRNAVTELDGKISRKEGPKADRRKDFF